MNVFYQKFWRQEAKVYTQIQHRVSLTNSPSNSLVTPHCQSQKRQKVSNKHIKKLRHLKVS